jgi:hypothetical protein
MQLIITLDPNINVRQAIEGRSAHIGQPIQGGILATPLIAAVRENEPPDYFNGTAEYSKSAVFGHWCLISTMLQNKPRDIFELLCKDCLRGDCKQLFLSIRFELAFV